MARVLLINCLMGTLFMAAQTGACMLPPELQAGGADAGPGAIPVILSAAPAPDFQFPGPIILDRQDTRVLSLTVLDNDIGDIIYVRLYVDYQRPNPEPAYGECQAAPTGETTRLVVCPVNSLCNPIGTSDLGDHLLEAMASDRPFISDGDPAATGQPLFRAVEDPTRAAWSIRSWVLRCNSPSEL